jgi:SAM-dependent methyltransferase
LACRECGLQAQVEDGIVDLRDDEPEFVTREAAGLERFADHMRQSGWGREDVLALPYRQDGYWYAQATAMHQVLGTPDLDLQPGKLLLDVGSNTCWASAMFAERGLEVVALDITSVQMQGLKTAEWWFEDKDVYFERVLSSMFDTNLSSDSFDFVWCCEVLHHNHLRNLKKTMVELHRVLKPGGKLLIVNEPLRTIVDPKLRPGRDVAQFDGHEHAYMRRTYMSAAQRAGFTVNVRGPWLHPIFRDEAFGISPRMSVIEGFRAAGAHAVRRSRRTRNLALWWKSYVGATSLHMTAVKDDHTGASEDD